MDVRRRFLEKWPVLILVLVAALMVGSLARVGSPTTRITLEFILGTFPNQDYSKVATPDLSTGEWLTVGVALRMLAVLAIPALLGLWVSYVTARTESRLRMDMQTYFAQRDTFFAMEVLRAVAGPLRQAGVPDEESRRLVLSAFQRANDELHRIQSQRITDALKDVRFDN